LNIVDTRLMFLDLPSSMVFRMDLQKRYSLWL